jgi:hypothetical protein
MRQSLPDREVELPLLIERWVTEGVITAVQAERMRADLGLLDSYPTALAAPPAHQERTSLVVEALGYLGGVVILVAAGLLADRYWSDLSTSGRLSVVAGAAAVLLTAGSAVPQRLGAAGVRLHAVLWLLSTAATAALLAVFGNDVLGWQGEDVGLLTSAGTATLAGALWWRLRTVLQQLVLFAALLATAGTAAAQLSGSSTLSGVAVWGTGAVWFLLGWGGLIAPRRAAFALGAVGMLIGAGFTIPTDAGIALALATVTMLVVTAVLFRDLVLLAVGAVGALQILPSAIVKWFPGVLAAPLALLVVGGLLVAAAIYIAQLRRDRPSAEAQVRDYAGGSPRAALGAAAAVAVAVTTVVLALGR